MVFLNQRDMIQRLQVKSIASTDDFEWQREVRYYWQEGSLILQIFKH